MEYTTIIGRYISELKNAGLTRFSLGDLIATLKSWGIPIDIKDVQKLEKSGLIINLGKGYYTWQQKKRRKSRF